MNRLTVTECRDPTAWDAYLEQTDGPAYGLWGWGDAVAEYGHDRYYLLARLNGDIVGALPLVHIESRLFGSKLVSPPYAARGSVVTGDDHADEATALLLERTRTLAVDLGVDFVSLRGGALGDADGFEGRTQFVTFDIDLKEGPDATWESIKESRRRQIRQAADEGFLEYDVVTTVDGLREYYDLHLDSMRGHGTPPHSFRFFRTLWDRLTGDGPGDLHVGLIRRNGEPINGIMDLSLGSTVYQWGVVTDYEYRELNGGSLLLWKSLERAAEAGYDSYEMGRTREGSGVYMFKKSFGGTKTWYEDSHYFPAGDGTLPHPEDGKYEPIKRIWRRLPIPLTRLIGPFVRKDISL